MSIGSLFYVPHVFSRKLGRCLFSFETGSTQINTAMTTTATVEDIYTPGSISIVSPSPYESLSEKETRCSRPSHQCGSETARATNLFSPIETIVDVSGTKQVKLTITIHMEILPAKSSSNVSSSGITAVDVSSDGEGEYDGNDRNDDFDRILAFDIVANSQEKLIEKSQWLTRSRPHHCTTTRTRESHNLLNNSVSPVLAREQHRSLLDDCLFTFGRNDEDPWLLHAPAPSGTIGGAAESIHAGLSLFEM